MNAKSALKNVNETKKTLGHTNYATWCLAAMKLFEKMTDGLSIHDYVSDDVANEMFSENKTVGEFVQHAMKLAEK